MELCYVGCGGITPDDLVSFSFLRSRCYRFIFKMETGPKVRRVGDTMEEVIKFLRFAGCKCCDRRYSLILHPTCNRGQKFLNHGFIVEFGHVQGRSTGPKPRGAQHSQVNDNCQVFMPLIDVMTWMRLA